METDTLTRSGARAQSSLICNLVTKAPAPPPPPFFLLPGPLLREHLGPQFLGAARGVPGEKLELHISWSIFTT